MDLLIGLSGLPLMLVWSRVYGISTNFKQFRDCHMNQTFYEIVRTHFKKKISLLNHVLSITMRLKWILVCNGMLLCLKLIRSSYRNMHGHIILLNHVSGHSE